MEVKGSEGENGEEEKTGIKRRAVVLEGREKKKKKALKKTNN